MPRIRRGDEPFARFHVMNRGIARRSLFEGAADVRFFKAHLARAVRDGLIELHAFCLMTTHDHVLVVSPCGRLADATLARCADSAAHRRVREHVAALRTQSAHASIATGILTASLRDDFPTPVGVLDVPRRDPAVEAGLLAVR